MNINPKTDSNIKLIKEWCKINFYFNRGVVFYANDERSQITPLPLELHSDFMNYNKNEFDTPLSHLIHILIEVGKKEEELEAEARLANMCENINQPYQF
jgi:hypothetical protein